MNAINYYLKSMAGLEIWANRLKSPGGYSKLIHKNRTLSYSDAAVLIEMGRMDEAEPYLLDRIDQLNGDFYGSLLPLAEAMEADGRPLPATVLYRALLDSILRRAQTKTYQHGVRYLKKLDRLAQSG